MRLLRDARGGSSDGWAHPRPSLFAVAAPALLLLFIGIHNAWDIVTYHVFATRRDK